MPIRTRSTRIEINDECNSKLIYLFKSLKTMFATPMMNQDMNFSNNFTKKLPNPSNFKIVKCKSFERGKIFNQKFKKIL